jgi:coiled-coil domain-containing protein 55
MSGTGLSYGLNLTKKQPLGSRPVPGKRKPIFDADDDSDDDAPSGTDVEEIGEFGGIGKPSSKPPMKNGLKPPSKPLGGLKKAPVSTFGDLSSTFSSKKHADAAAEVDPNVYAYDEVYDSLKPQKKTTVEDTERKPKYMKNLLAASAVRKRDADIAEERKLAKEREAEGDEFADKEKFVTSAYKKQQEENRRLAEEEKIKEAAEAKRNKGTGMIGFYKNMLERGEQRHAEVLEASKEIAKIGSADQEKGDDENEKTEADLAREINQKKSGAIAVNDEGQVVDKRQLLKGGLNIVSKPKASGFTAPSRGNSSLSDRSHGTGFVGAGGGKQAMRERQTRMMEAQLEQATKRANEADEEEMAKVERAAKSRKTNVEIMGAKERYLARKKEAEKAKKRGELS